MIVAPGAKSVQMRILDEKQTDKQTKHIWRPPPKLAPGAKVDAFSMLMLVVNHKLKFSTIFTSKYLSK